MSRIGRVFINVSELRRVPVDPNDLYYLEAVGDDTLVRLRHLGALLKRFAPYGFLRIHRNHAGQLARHPGEPPAEGEGRLGG